MANRTWLGATIVRAVLVAVVAGCAAGASPTPPPPTARAALPAGAYSTSVFAPSVGFTLPEGWVIAADSTDYVALQPAPPGRTRTSLFSSPPSPPATGPPPAPLFVSPPDPAFRWVIAGAERLRLHLLDVPSGGTVVVDIHAFDGSLMDSLLPVAAPIVTSMSFGAPSA